MKPRTMFVTLILICLLVSSCSNDLTRSKAEEIIRSKVTLPKNGKVEELYLYWGGHCFMRYVQGPCGPDAMPSPTGAVTESVKALESSGLVTITYEGDTSRIALTEKGQQYAVGATINEPGNDGNGRTTPLSKVMVVKTTVDLGAITGITQDEGLKTARVEYTVIVKPTPFGIACGLAPTTVNETVSFKKYDDGWRIVQ
jgi:hypothetical protein